MKDQLKILIIDDNPADSTLLKRFLNKLPLWEMNIETASNGHEAYQRLLNFSADLIFIDYLLGSQNGIDVIRDFRAYGISLPMILLTGYGNEAVVVDALRAGASDYLSKNDLTPEAADRTIRHLIQKQTALEKLRKTESKLQKIIENTDTSLATLDENGFIIEANNAFLRLIGVKDENLVIGRHITDWNTDPTREVFSKALENCLREGVLNDFETSFIHPNANSITFALVNATTENESNGKLISLLLRNITDRKQYEEKLKSAKIKAEEADRLKSAFLANLSHEIRTPMNAILGFATILSDSTIPEEQKQECIYHINSSGRSLLNLIDDIIDVSKIVAQQVKVIKSTVYLNRLFDDLMLTFKAKNQNLHGNNVQLICSKVIADPEFIILADQYRLKQVLSNLIENAIKFTDKGFIEFGYKLKDSGNIEFYVKDTGIGISKDKQNLIFDWFRKIDDDISRLYRGSGIGLTISSSLVGLMGSEIKVKSELGVGSVFYFNLALEMPKSENQGTHSKMMAQPNTNLSWEGKNILIAEDEETNFKFLKAALSRMNTNVFWARNGIEAVDICRNQNIDLVLMDIKMPEMDGYQATRIIKTEFPKKPIIAQTAYAMAGEKEIILEAGCDAYLSKPIKISEMIQLVGKYLYLQSETK